MKILATALVLSTSLTLSACGQAGQQWFDPDKTFKLFDQPEVKGVNDTQEQMAKDAFASGDYARAAQVYQQLVDSPKTTPEQQLRYKLAWADCTRRAGNIDTALAMFEELHQQNPANLDAAEGKGLTLMATGKTAEAGRAFAEIMDKDPKRWRTLNALGILFVTKNMIPEAMAYYAEALANSPDNAAILNNVGLSRAVDKEYPRAIEALQQAARVSKMPSQKKQVELNLAMVYGVSGDLDTARTVAGKYLEGPALDNNLGLYAHLAKDDALAKSYLNMALSQSPTFYERAWENLDVINDNAQADDSTAAPLKSVAAPGKLPKLDALKSGEARKEKPRSKGRKAKAFEKPAVTESGAEAAPVSNSGGATVEPAIEVPVSSPSESPPQARAAPAAKPIDKPSGLIVGPSEGN